MDFSTVEASEASYIAYTTFPDLLIVCDDNLTSFTPHSQTTLQGWPNAPRGLRAAPSMLFTWMANYKIRIIKKWPSRTELLAIPAL